MSEEQIWTIKPGTKIEIDGIKAIVTAVMVEANDAISYRVVWWNGNSRHSEWLTESEVGGQDIDPDELQEIGFHATR